MTTIFLDDATERHFQTWRDVHQGLWCSRNEPEEVETEMRRIVSDDPTILDHMSWSNLRDIADRNISER
jgi:hypothetical protein